MTNRSLVFIDTNIFLDFYRLRGGAAVRQLEALRRHRSSLILTDQVKMEFLKNRQNAVAEIWKEVPAPAVNLPAVLQDYGPSKAFKKKMMEAKTLHAEMQSKARGMLENPREEDIVFREVEQLFSEKSRWLLAENSSEFEAIFARAQRRFDLGQPPRKNKDNSIGDALNWEWVVECAIKAGGLGVMLVSRDGDFEGGGGQKSALNDYLEYEFSSRVGKNCKLTVTKRLTDALSILEETVSSEDRKAEERLLETQKMMRTHLQKIKFSSEVQRALLEAARKSTESQARLEKLKFDELLGSILFKRKEDEEITDGEYPEE
ncbi:PIN domain-containing protein [Limimaricola cinnabarinus]|uniref:PIN domain-containing protein n=1 Tax=Limimaricola cinnabarinus TaxID=1125964 RepID=UPI0024931A44|nr:PIN domain-containing protein [Limimaricola cinnabarinus]